MKKINRTMFFSILVVLAYVLSACSGAPAGQSTNDQLAQPGQAQDVVFTGTVESVNGNQWIVSGQTITVEDGTAANIAMGDNVKVEAHVREDGTVTAVHIEISGADDANSNSSNGNDGNSNDSNANVNDNTSNSNDNQGDNSNASNGNGNGNGNDNSNPANDQEVSGVVEAITTDSITINGVVYMIADFTEFKDIIAMGNQVKVYVVVNADGTLTIREIEKSTQTSLDNGNSNSNSNGSDDNFNANSGSNSNGDDKGGSNDNGNGDDHGNDSGGGNDDGGGNGNGNG